MLARDYYRGGGIEFGLRQSGGKSRAWLVKHVVKQGSFGQETIL